MSEFYNYNGPSMNPTLKAGDGLRLKPCKPAAIRVGDVVVYPHPDTGRNVVHRVINVTSTGLVTRGDNNSETDPYTVRGKDVIGKVVAIRRKNRTIPLRGGLLGSLTGKAMRTRRALRALLVKVFQPSYHWLAGLQLCRFVRSRCITINVYRFKRPNGVEMQARLGNLLVARYLPGAEEWLIKPPFRFVVDESMLMEGSAVFKN